MIDYGHGIRLSWASTDDKLSFFHWRNNEKIWKWCRQKGPITYTQHTNYWFAVDSAQDMVFLSILCGKGDLVNGPVSWETVGCAGLTSIDHVNARAEFSLYIGPEHHGYGYGKRALKTLFDYGFGYLNLNQIWGETFDGNPALQTFLDIGMTRDGTRRNFYYRDGAYIDAHLVSLMRDEWKMSQLLSR